MFESNSAVLTDSDVEELDSYSPLYASSPRQYDYSLDESRWDEEDRARQMVRYHDRHYYGADQQRVSSNRLAVPIYERSPRHRRTRSDTRADARNYRTQEVRPAPQPLRDGKPVSADETRSSGHAQSKAPGSPTSLRVPPKIIQPDPPNRGRSPNGEPRIYSQYLNLQDELAHVREACRRFINVEPADAQDLSFAKINDHVKAFKFDLEVWQRLANIDQVPRNNLDDRELRTVTAASRTLSRLTDQAIALSEACSKAKPGDLKYLGLPQVDDETDLYAMGHDEAESTQDPMESLGFIISTSLHSIELQIQNLKRLIRSLQETTPDAKEEVKAVAELVDDTVHFFGSEEAIRRYPVDDKYSGRRALNEARSATTRYR